MKIILDVMGGDNPPAEIIKGALLARKELDARIALVGDESIIRDVLSAEGADSSDFDIIGSDSVIETIVPPTTMFTAAFFCTP